MGRVVSEARTHRRRLSAAVLIVFAVVAVFSIRLVDIQIVNADTLKTAAVKNYTTATLWGTRGDIVDAKGTVLATSVDRFDITAAPVNADPAGFDRRVEVNGELTREHVSVAQALEEISAITGADIDEMTSALTDDPNAPWALLVKGIKLEQFQQVVALRIPWVYNEPRPARSYPNGAIAGNLVGLMGTDGPLSGTEYQWNECLAGQNGEMRYTFSKDYVRMPGSEVIETPAVDGGTVHLTIDADLQWFAQQALAEKGTELGAQWGTAFVVEVKTGKIRAAADWPSVDPNDLNSVGPEDSGARSFTAPYEPGSTIKTATVAALLDAGKLTAGTHFTIPAGYTIPEANFTIRDSVLHGGGLHYTTAGVLVESSNIGIAQMTELMPLAQRIEYLKKFGFGNGTSGADFLGEDSGFVRSVDENDVITSITQQFGQGMTATSAQVVSLYQTIANGGVRIPLTLVEGCELPDGSYTDVPRKEGTRVVSQSAADTTMTMLEGVTTQYHLASVLAVPGYRIAAKSGTAEVADGNGYGSERIVSIAGAFPVDDPQFAVVVTFAKPVTMRTSAAAAPTFNAIVKQVIKTYRVTPSTVPAPKNPLYW